MIGAIKPQDAERAVQQVGKTEATLPAQPRDKHKPDEQAALPKLEPVSLRADAKVYTHQSAQQHGLLFANDQSFFEMTGMAARFWTTLYDHAGNNGFIDNFANAPEMPKREAEAAGVSGTSGVDVAESLELKTVCKTCRSRVYQDGSHDSGVSYQTPKGMPASQSAVLVASHEGEHVTRETAKAQEEGKIITEKKVTMQMRFCPECNRMYCAGGTTTIGTISKGNSGLSASNPSQAMNGMGSNMDKTV